jgi:aminopeptidase N
MPCFDSASPSMVLRRAIAFAVLATICTSALFTPKELRAEEELKTAASRPVDILHIRLELAVKLKERTVAGSATIDFAAVQPTQVLSLNAVGHEVSAVRVLGAGAESKPLSFENSGKTIDIDLGRRLERGEKRKIRIEYQVRNPEAGLYFFQPTKAEPDVPLTVWSQGEPVSNSHWFPCLDNPNERQTTELLATVDDGFEVLSNGKLESKRQLNNGQVQFHWKQSKPHVAYLVTLVVGEFEVGRTEWRGRPVTYYVHKSRAADMERTFRNTTKMLDFFSERFGIEYPWEKYAQVVVEQFMWGGMENTSATTLYPATMHDERALVDGSPDWLIAHELGHQWWGDLVTCKDWSHLWLNEGFATYCEVLWAEHYKGKDERDYLLLKESRQARSGSALTRPVVDRHYPDPSTMFDSRAYPKGGWILHMLRSQLGDDDFFRGIQRYGTVYAYQTVETNDLRQVFERLYGVSLERFFHDWTERPGHPTVLVKSSYSAKDKQMKLEVKQTQKAEPFYIPLHIELTIPGGEPVELRRLMTDREFTVYLPVEQRPTLIRVDPEVTLLADIKEEKARDWWQAQLTAPTVIERIRAIEHLVAGKTDANREAIAKVLKDDPFWGVRVEAAKAIGKLAGNISRKALLAGLAQPDAKVRKACVDGLGSFSGNEDVISALKAKYEKGDESYIVEAAMVTALVKILKVTPVALLQKALEKPSHREAIRLAALRGLAKSDDSKILKLLVEWTQRGKPRTCRHEAIRQVAAVIIRAKPDAKITDPIVDRFVEMFDEGEGARTRQVLAETLGRLGTRARVSGDRLRVLADADPNGRVRSAAKKAAEDSQKEPGTAAELARLRKEVEAANKRNSNLEKRLEKLESK